jgi:hypothetical protein
LYFYGTIYRLISNHLRQSPYLNLNYIYIYIYYTRKLNSTFDVDRPRTWKTVCSKCRSLHTICCS